MQRTSVLMLFGGESAEHDVSISSARNVFAALDEQKYDVKLGYIDKFGKWWLLPALETEISTHGHPQLVPVLGSSQLTTLPESFTIQPDVILPILHGPHGEDGTVQGLAKLLHVPIVGCQVASSAVCMDKALAKQLLVSAGVPTVGYKVHRRSDPTPNFDQLITELGTPLFIKPANMGSSVGISKVHDEEGFSTAIEEAFKHDDKILIEQAANGRELEVAVLGDAESTEVSGVGEVKPDGDFYDYVAKYDSTKQTQIIIPAELPEHIAEEVRASALRAFKALDCSGLARVDFFLVGENTIYINEVNTMPGFTNTSVYPMLLRERGISYPQIIEKLISLSLK